MDDNKRPNTIYKSFTAGLIGGLIACATALGIQHFLGPTANGTIVSVNLKQIIDMQRGVIVDKYKGAYNDENAKKAQQEIQLFTDKLQDGIQKIGAGRTVLLKDVVLTEATDITDQLKEYVGLVPAGDDKNAKK